MLKTVKAEQITAVVKEMCIEANHFLSDDMKVCMNRAVENLLTGLCFLIFLTIINFSFLQAGYQQTMSKKRLKSFHRMALMSLQA